jgi:hypothetical protein
MNIHLVGNQKKKKKKEEEEEILEEKQTKSIPQGRGQTSGSVLKSLTALSLAPRVIVPSSLLYSTQARFSEFSTKSNMLVHWEKTIALIGPSTGGFD